MAAGCGCSCESCHRSPSMGFHMVSSKSLKKGTKIMGKIIIGHRFLDKTTLQHSSEFRCCDLASSIIQLSFHDDHLEAVPLSGQCGVTDGNFAVGMGFVGSWRRFLWGPLKTQSLNLDLVWIKNMFSPFHPFSCIFSSIFHPSFLWILGKVRTGYPHSHVHCRCGQVGAFNPNSRSRASVRVPVVVSCGATDNFSPLMSSCHVVSAVDG